MSDPVFEGKKSATLELIKKRDCDAAFYIDANGIDYASMLTMLFAFGEIFDCERTYLDNILALWTDADLLAQGVYLNKTLVNQDNIIYAAGTTVSNISNLNPNTFVPGLTLTKDSHIEHLIIQGTTELDFLIVADGSSITDIYVEPGAIINYILIKTCDLLNPSSIGSILGPYGYIAGDVGSTYGGDDCDNILL